MPEIGLVRLRSAGGPEADLELRQDGERPAGTFSARLPRLLESVEVEVLAGDAWTDPITLRVVTDSGVIGTIRTEARTVTVGALTANEPDAQPRPATAPVPVMQDDYTLAYLLGFASA